MQRLRMRIDTDTHDPGRWGHSFANLAELIVPSLDAVGARSVVEVGAYAGDFTNLLLEWAARNDARVTAVDPLPQPALERLDHERDDLELVRRTGAEALRTMDLPDAVVIDGDHNWHTVTEELEAIDARAGDRPLPLVLFHDVAWPHGRRDAYYTPETIPEDRRQPIEHWGALHPGEPGTRPGGLPYPHPAAREGGPRNGVLTAVEDFVAAREGLRFVLVEAFFGFGALWPVAAPYDAALAAHLDPWDRNPLAQRLEANRVFHLTSSHVQQREAALARERVARKDDLLSTLMQSKAFALAEWLSRRRQGGTPAVSRAEVRRALDA